MRSAVISPARRRAFVATLVAALAGALASEGHAARFPASGLLVVPSAAVRAAPSSEAAVVHELSDFRPDFRPRVVYATKEAVGPYGSRWLRIALPGRPRGRAGWIPANAVEVDPVDTRVVIKRGSRRLTVYRDGKRVLQARVAVGKRGARTPLGRFYVTARFRPSNPFLGVFALETSAYSKLSDWPGGGIVGIHGTSRPDLLGDAVSHGCVRVHNKIAHKLRRLVQVGATVDVRRG